MKKLIYILVSIIFISCGSRKVNKSDVKIEEKQTSETTIQTNTTTNIKQKDSNITIIDKSEEEFIIEPIDTSKEIVVNGKTYKNVKIRHKKIKDNSTYQNTKIVSKNVLKHEIKHNKSNKVNNKRITNKKIDKKESLVKYFYLLLLIILLYIIFKYRYLFNLLNTTSNIDIIY